MESDSDRPARPGKPSEIPSWAMLGFALGVLFVLALPRRHYPAPPQPVVMRAAHVALSPPRISTVEAVFDQWGKYAVWHHDLTQVALWNSETSSYSDCFEVLRSGEALYFRSIPHLTLPVLTHGVPANSPLEFTETEDQREEWLKQSAEENWRAMGEALHPRGPPGK